MGILNIHPAKREGARMVIGLAGASGSGKTCTALHLAFGMVNYDSSKIGLLDTENKRGSLFADVLKDANGVTQPFLIGDLVPPFSPDRYVTAIKEFESAGVEVLIIDSVTHEWEGTGGCGEIADNFIGGNAKKTALGWAIAKKPHKRFINTLLQCDMDIICCVRAREQTSFKNPSKPVSLGQQPIQEKNFMFEMTASLLMKEEGMVQVPLKCPGDLRPFFGRCNGYITDKDGLALREWVDGGSKIDKECLRYENRLLMNAEKGTAHTSICWDKTPQAVREALGKGFMDKLFASAKGYDDLTPQQPPQGPNDAIQNHTQPPTVKNTNQPVNTQLINTPEWQRWVEDSELFPEVAIKMQSPTTPSQCVEACKYIQVTVDAINS